MRKIILNNEPDLEAKLKAFPYQNEAYESIKDLQFAAIFHEQGLGKTKIAIDLLLYWLEFKEIDTVLVVTKKQLVHNWEEEFKVHTALKPAVLTSNKSDNFYVFNGPARVVVTNFEVISSEINRFKLYLKARNVAIIIDESAKLKNPESKLSQSFFELSDLFKIRVIMTGTPVANRPYDIWAQIYFLDKGKSLGSDFNEFKKETDLTNDLNSNDVKRENFEKNIASVFEKIRWFSVRETKNSGIVKLPTKEYFNRWTDFLPEQQALYNKIRDDLAIEVRKGEQTIYDDSSSSLKRLLRLVQVTSNPQLITDENIHSGKENELEQLINEIMEKQEKCIVWSSFIGNVDQFSKKYKNFNAVKVHGKLDIETRNKSIEKFKNGEAKILFATPQAAKEGLTLTVANHVIFYDRGFSLDDYLQAQDRIHRISQTKTCYIYNIMIRDSIDEWIDILLKAKQNAAFVVQGDINKDKYQQDADYSFGDMVKKILGIYETEEGLW